MKTLKKALSIILCLALMLSCVAGMQISASAEGEETGETTSDIVISTNTECNFAGRDDQEGYFANVEVSLAEATSFASLGLKVQYDSSVVALSYVSDDYTKLNPNFSLETSNDQKANPYTIIWYYQGNLAVEAGKIAYLNFMYKGEGEIPEDFTTTVTVIPFDPFDQDGNPLSLNAESFTVTFLPPVAEECAHSYSYEYDKDAHWQVCSECGDTTANEAHSFDEETGLCVCGFKIDKTFAMGFKITADNKVGARLQVPFSKLSADCKDYYIEMNVGYYDFNNEFSYGTRKILLKHIDDGETLPDGYYAKQDENESNNKNDIYYYKNIAAYEFDCPIQFTLYFMDAEGKLISRSKTYQYTVRERVLSMCSVDGADSDAIYVDLMNYGAAVQTQFVSKYPNSDLAEAPMPTVGFEKYQAFKTPDSVAAANKAQNNKFTDNYGGKVGSVRKILVEDCNKVEFGFTCGLHDAENLRLKINYTDSIYGEREIVLSYNELTKVGSAYYITISDISLYDATAVITAEVFDVSISETDPVYTRRDSIESYAYEKQNDNDTKLVAICDAIMKSSYSIRKVVVK